MKKIILSLLFIIFSVIVYSQGYPRIETDSLGHKFVVMTIEQAQKIDNNFELLNLLKKQGFECDSLNLYYLRVIDNYGRQVALFELDINTLRELVGDKDRQILNLTEQLTNITRTDSLCEQQKLNNEEEIKVLKKEVKTQKIKKLIGYCVGLLGGLGSLTLVLVILL